MKNKHGFGGGNVPNIGDLCNWTNFFDLHLMCTESLAFYLELRGCQVVAIESQFSVNLSSPLFSGPISQGMYCKKYIGAMILLYGEWTPFWSLLVHKLETPCLEKISPLGRAFWLVNTIIGLSIQLFKGGGSTIGSK